MRAYSQITQGIQVHGTLFHVVLSVSAVCMRCPPRISAGRKISRGFGEQKGASTARLDRGVHAINMILVLYVCSGRWKTLLQNYMQWDRVVAARSSVHFTERWQIAEDIRNGASHQQSTGVD